MNKLRMLSTAWDLACTREFNMGAYLTKLDKPVRGLCLRRGCGTAGCIAGGIALKNGCVPYWSGDQVHTYRAMTPDGYDVEVDYYAAEWLGLTHPKTHDSSQSGWLFCADWLKVCKKDEYRSLDDRLGSVSHWQAMVAVLVLVVCNGNTRIATRVMRLLGLG